jgi:hypothetical protein
MKGKGYEHYLRHLLWRISWFDFCGHILASTSMGIMGINLGHSLMWRIIWINFRGRKVVFIMGEAHWELLFFILFEKAGW